MLNEAHSTPRTTIKRSYLQQKLPVFSLERKSETVDDAAEDLKEFPDSIELLRLVDEAEKDVVDVLADERAQTEELAINPV